MTAELDAASGTCTYCGGDWDARHEKYGCPDEAEVHFDEFYEGAEE